MTDRTTNRERTGSLWNATADRPRDREPLARDVDVDVAIVGAGYTGLWTAYYLSRANPNVRIAVIDQAHAGFGASGRNGGWCSAIFPVGPRKLAQLHGPERATALRLAMQDAVDEVGAVAVDEGMQIDFAKGGCVTLVRSPAQLTRARADVESARGYGIGERDLRWLSGEEARSITGAQGVLGAMYSPHCAALHPGRLVCELAERVERGGVTIYEQTAARSIAPGVVVTDRGRIQAELIVRATEGYTARLPGFRRSLLPIYSLMIATEPLPDGAWDEIGLRGRETFTDHRHLRIYGQRTADGRLAFGGRGAPYHFGSAIRPAFDTDTRIHAGLESLLAELFPVVAGHAITYAWGGPLAIARDWHPSVGLDRTTGIAWAGGYVGDGVATANLAGRTLSDLILGRTSDLTALAWVNHRSRRWEPEPLRWLGVNAGLHLVGTADREEARSGKPARRATTLARLLGY
ncbi:MAG TPA: FAD-binding oxidoreductase [Solirubrobacteraceae bacterium]